ncbi:MAG TPA: PEP-CTERM sorting domain-containing protein [Anaerohalosphaeraceae bacterium]|nr:PEP-CTERM sorting domain-containing protein [Anaerohalosphaeraceae bacterium]
MKKLFLRAGLLFAFIFTSSSFGALSFKMTADKTTLTVGQTTKVSLFAYAEEAAGMNGLNSWQLSAFVSGTGMLKVVPGSLNVIKPFAADVLTAGINSPSGAIRDLSMTSVNAGIDSSLGVGGYQKIAEFTVEALGAGQVVYTLGDGGGGFGGILRDYNPLNPATWGNMLGGVFNEAESQRVFTIVPEPASLVLLGSMGLMVLKARRMK